MRTSRCLATIVVVLAAVCVGAACVEARSQPAPSAWQVASRLRVEVVAADDPWGGDSVSRAAGFLGEHWLVLRGADGVTLLATDRSGPYSATMTQVAGATLAGDVLDMGADGLMLANDLSFSWEEFRLSLRDADGDGVLEAATGTARGSIDGILGDVIESLQVEVALTGTADDAAPRLTLYADEYWEPPLSPVDALRVAFSEPLEWATVGPQLRVLAAGEEVGFDATPVGLVAGLATGARLQPRAFLPFGARLELATDGVTDLAGHAATSSGAFAVMADGGPMTGNPGFENGLNGWSAAGAAEIVGRHEVDDPVQSAQARIQTGGRLIGYVDVPEDATTMTFRAAVYSEAGQFDAGRSVTVTVNAGDGEVMVFDADAHAGAVQECACEQLGQRIAPLEVSFDLRPWRGRRLVLSAEARAAGYFGVNYFALLLDDFRIARE